MVNKNSLWAIGGAVASILAISQFNDREIIDLTNYDFLDTNTGDFDSIVGFQAESDDEESNKLQEFADFLTETIGLSDDRSTGFWMEDCTGAPTYVLRASVFNSEINNALKKGQQTKVWKKVRRLACSPYTTKQKKNTLRAVGKLRNREAEMNATNAFPFDISLTRLHSEYVQKKDYVILYQPISSSFATNYNQWRKADTRMILLFAFGKHSDVY